ncbi:MAG: hypothetical protein AB3X44_03340 [Leptothrix sp. (in: b-proteobacteria)]
MNPTFFAEPRVKRSFFEKVGQIIWSVTRPHDSSFDPVAEADERVVPSLGIRAPGNPTQRCGTLAGSIETNFPDPTVLERTTLAWRLYPKASQWLIALPVETRPILTANRHPNVVNHLALIWDYPSARDAYLNELLLPANSGRHDFSIEVLDEMIQLCAISLGRSITGPALELAA